MSAAAFEEIFHDPPRPQQVVALRSLAAAEVSDIVVAEGPTGIGKSRVAVMHAVGMVDAHREKLRRVVYACHTKKLQTQLAKDARGWNLDATDFMRDRPFQVVCVFGTSNYWCESLLHKALEQVRQRRQAHGASSSSSSSSVAEARVMEHLASMDTQRAELYDVPFEEHFQEACEACEIAVSISSGSRESPVPKRSSKMRPRTSL